MLYLAESIRRPAAQVGSSRSYTARQVLVQTLVRQRVKDLESIGWRLSFEMVRVGMTEWLRCQMRSSYRCGDISSADGPPTIGISLVELARWSFRMRWRASTHVHRSSGADSTCFRRVGQVGVLVLRSCAGTTWTNQPSSGSPFAGRASTNWQVAIRCVNMTSTGLLPVFIPRERGPTNRPTSPDVGCTRFEGGGIRKGFDIALRSAPRVLPPIPPAAYHCCGHLARIVASWDCVCDRRRQCG